MSPAIYKLDTSILAVYTIICNNFEPRIFDAQAFNMLIMQLSH